MLSRLEAAVCLGRAVDELTSQMHTSEQVLALGVLDAMADLDLLDASPEELEGVYKALGSIGKLVSLDLKYRIVADRA